MDEPARPAGEPPADPDIPSLDPAPAPEQAPADARPELPAAYPLSFTGTGAEYFRIWIVNLALTILTLGIFSAWAKVRRQQFFYRHTRLAGSGFDYHGEPIAILKGRFVGLVLFGLYSAIGYVGLTLALVILLALGLAVPWLLSRSLRFRLHNTSYRGLRFRFSGETAPAYWVFLALPILMVLSLFTIGPLWHHRIKRYQFANASFGRTPFEYGVKLGEFYITYVVGVALFVACIVLMAIGIGVVATAIAVASRGDPDVSSSMTAAIMIGTMFVYIVSFVAVQSVITARLHNATWSAMRLDRHRFDCRISWMRLFGIQLTNLFATLGTIGLFRPFAQVRLARFIANSVEVLPGAALDDLEAAPSDDVSAVGEEAVGFFDLDIGF